MKQALFGRLDANGDGLLLSPELWPYAVKTGFDGSEAEWEEEYAMLCRDMGRHVAEGLSALDFFKMIDDDSAEGCYCDDEELRSLLVEIAEPTAVPDHAAGQEAPRESSKEEEVQSREEMKQTLFRRLDTNSDGLLLSPELWPFVVKTGFDGSEAEWEEEYAMLCRDMGRSVAEGLSASDFFKMVDDDSAQGCYCEDEELRSLLVEIPAPAADEDVGREAPRESSKEEEGLQGRDEMKQRLFRRLDTNHDGLLLSPELWPFVVRTGFDGSEAEWEEEYAMLCRDMGRSVAEGLSASDFFKMLDDDSSQGCYCEDEELRSLLVEIGAVAADDAAGQEAPGQSSQEEEEVQGREAMKQTLFRRLDTNSDGLLLSPELWPFVVKTGFDGSEAEWEEEYAMLCRDMGRSVAEGLSASDFFKMVDDDSEQGCYCEDEELRSLLVEIPAPAADGAASRRPRPAAVSSVAARSPTVTSAPARAPPSKPAEGPQSAEAPDPWGAAVPDPWAAPAAKAAAKGRKGEKGKGKGKDRAAGPAGAAPRQQAPAAPPQDNWAQWRDSGKLGPEHDPSKPALNAAKLLEASRAALAARKAREAQEVEQEAAEIAAAALGAVAGGDPDDDGEGAPARPPAAGLLEAPRAPAAARPARGAEGAGRPPGEGGEGLREAGAPGQRPGSGAGASGGPPPPAARVPKVASMSEALGQIGYALCQLATGEAGAAGDLVTAVLGSPSTPHALAVASSAMRSMLQGRFGEAETLLALDELVFLPGAGDASVLHGLGELARCIGVHGAPFLNKAMLPALVKVDDKARSVRLAAESATREIMSSNSRFAFEALLPALTAALDLKRSPTMKLHAMRLIAECWRGRDGEAAVSHKLPQLLPAVVALLVDTVSEVRAAAVDTVKVLFRLCRSRDLEPFYSDILACAQGTKDVSACVRELAEVVFVQQVEASALAVVLPVLIKALRTRNLRTQRQACIIAKNMCGLVSAVADVTPFTPQLLPQLERISEDASDPDVRAVAGRACGSLAEAADLDVVGSVRQELRAVLHSAFDDAESRQGSRGDVLAPCPAPVRAVILEYVVTLSVCLGHACLPKKEVWAQQLVPLLEPLLGVGGARQMVNQVREVGGRLSSMIGERSSEPAASTPSGAGQTAGLLCDCTFTLACGAATLLVGANLRLERGRIYGFVGGNDSGKSTILRAIHERRVSDFPPMEEVVTTLVEHGVGEKHPECEMTPVQYLLADEMIRSLKLSEYEVARALGEWGFQREGRLRRPIRTLSGGWRMKLGLARAMLQSADLLLLDEPTGHLDVEHIAWLAEYVQGLRADRSPAVSTLIVSHDSSFLDRVCTDIIHVDGNRLHVHAGDFSSFLAKVPDARLGTGSAGEPEKVLAAFTLPEPGPLEGVRSRGRRFLSLDHVFFSYEAGGLPVVRGASVECCLRSRVAIMGPNGAGKSTLAGLVVGELAPDGGSAWRHPALRTAFVAQHAFHHLESRMDLTATQYILWRFEGNEDREAMEMRADDVETADPRPHRLHGSHLVACAPDQEEDAVRPDVVLDRRQRGRLGYEYEVRLQGHQDTVWVPRAQMAAMGCLGMAAREDERQAAQRSLEGRPLTTPGVEAHLAGFGLGAEEASHRRLGALSHGQRARAVLAAATWLAPHLLVLDEPTNYLDGPALKALVAGLQGFGGGVLVISHTASFLDEVCSERWNMCDGVLRREGAPSEEEPAREDQQQPAPAVARPRCRPPGGAPPADGAGFEASLEAAKASAKEQREKKRLKRLKELRRKNGEQVSSSDDEWYQDLLRKANARPKAAP